MATFDKIGMEMVSVAGIYQNGKLKLEKDFSTENPVKVIVTFLEDVQESIGQNLSVDDFSFLKSMENLENAKSSFSDSVMEERR